MNRVTQSGSIERLYLDRGGLAEERFPLAMLSVPRIRETWGPGLYRGQWLGREPDGSFRGFGRIREFQLLPQAGAPAGAQPRRELPRLGFAAHEAPQIPAERAIVPVREESTEVVDARVRAEREIAKLRLETERELNAERLRFYEERTTRELAELRELVASGRRDDDDDRPAGPWDFLGPLVEKLAPTLEQIAPALVERFLKSATGGS